MASFLGRIAVPAQRKTGSRYFTGIAVTAVGGITVFGVSRLYQQSAIREQLDGQDSSLKQEDADNLHGDCDCAPLWECMKEGNKNCGHLEQQLKLCLDKQKKSWN